MTKKIFAICLGLMLAVGFVAGSASKASAGEAVRIYVEFSSTAAIAKASTLYARVLALDVNDELATSFGGSDLDQSSIELISEEYADEVIFSDTVAGVNTATATADSDGMVTLTSPKAWREFAVKYSDVTTVKNDTIKVTLVKGSSKLESTTAITVSAPSANCYVVKTGGVGVAPAVLDELSQTQQEDNGAIKKAGSSITVDVFAAYYNGSKYYFTTNVPSGAEAVTLSGTPGNAATSTQSVYSGSLTLASGRATVTTPAITDLKIPALLVNGNLGTKTSQSYQLASMAWIFENGLTVTFKATTTAMRSIGTKNGDNTGGTVAIDGNPQTSVGYFIGSDTTALLRTGSSLPDIARLVPETLATITMVGLPVNEIYTNGASHFAGFGGIKTTGYTPVPADAYYLASDWKRQASFKTFGQSGTNTIFGAVLGRDVYNNPAPFSEGDGNIAFTVKYGTGEPLGWNINIADGSTAEGLDKITATRAYQAFLPFAITHTNATNSGTTLIATITDTYLELSANSTGTLAKSTALDGIKGGTTEKMMSWYIADMIASITPTVGTTASTAGSSGDYSIAVEAVSGNGESFNVSGIRQSNAKAMGIAGADATTPSTSLSVAGDGEDNDMTIFTANNSTSGPFILKITGATSAVTAVRAITPTIAAADSGDFTPTLVSPYIKSATIGLDEEESHNEITIATGSYMILDAFGNAYSTLINPATYFPLKDADVSSELYVAADNGSASGTLFPGASAKVSDDTIELKFNIDNITVAQRKAVLKVTAGTSSAETLLTLNAVKQLALKTVFVPVPGIDDTPATVNLADQSSVLFVPVTGTSAVGSIAVDIEPTDGKITLPSTSASASSQTVNLTTASYKKYFTVNPDATHLDNMTVDASSDYGDATLLVNFNPDFNAPTIGASLTAIDCGFEITITDDKAVNAAATTVAVSNAAGEDITSTLTVTTASDNGTKAVIKVIGTGAGSFNVTITAADAAGNPSTATRIVTVTSATVCAAPKPACGTIDPAFVVYGAGKQTVTITGTNTNFVQGTTTVSFSCPEVAVGTITVKSTTELTADVTPAATGTDVTCDLIIASDNLTCTGVFQVVTEVIPQCIDKDNDTYGEGCAAGADCNDNDATVHPGATDVCGDGIDQDCSGADAVCPSTCSIALSKSSFNAGIILPRLLVTQITLTGADDNKGAVSFDATSVIKLFQAPIGTDKILVVGLILPAAKGKTVAVSVAGCDDTADITVK